jgi:hypothetical protein
MREWHWEPLELILTLLNGDLRPMLYLMPELTANLAPHLAIPWAHLQHWVEPIGQVYLPDLLPHNWHLLATDFNFKEPDFAGDIGKSWAHVVKTGQVWAFLVGAFFGYLIKTFTSFG